VVPLFPARLESTISSLSGLLLQRQRSLPDIEDRPDSIEIMAHGHALDDDPDLTGVVSAGPSAGDPQLGGLAVDQMGLFDQYVVYMFAGEAYADTTRSFLNPDL